MTPKELEEEILKEFEDGHHWIATLEQRQFLRSALHRYHEGVVEMANNMAAPQEETEE